MQTYQIDIRNKQKKSWNTFSPGWRNWDDFTMRFLHTQGEQMIAHLDLKPDDRVLDIAAGTGEPGLTIASIVHKGSVTAVDLSEGMLQIAMEKAEARAIYNFHPQVADACDLPFEDASFDVVCCRLGFMFFPDMQLAAREMSRVLKPGGKIVTTVWGIPEKNLWITAIMGVIKKYVDLPVPSPNEPGMFRCAQPGLITALFEETGLIGGEELEVNGEIDCRSVDEYWSFMNDVVPPVVAVFKEADPAIQAKIKKEVYNLLEEKLPGERKQIPFGARLFKAEKNNDNNRFKR
ncbi:MAG: methyltransferase domain-containing protein [Saprospiraceae bacterium]